MNSTKAMALMQVPARATHASARPYHCRKGTQWQCMCRVLCAADNICAQGAAAGGTRATDPRRKPPSWPLAAEAAERSLVRPGGSRTAASPLAEAAAVAVGLPPGERAPKPLSAPPSSPASVAGRTPSSAVPGDPTTGRGRASRGVSPSGGTHPAVCLPLPDSARQCHAAAASPPVARHAPSSRRRQRDVGDGRSSHPGSRDGHRAPPSALPFAPKGARAWRREAKQRSGSGGEVLSIT